MRPQRHQRMAVQFRTVCYEIVPRLLKASFDSPALFLSFLGGWRKKGFVLRSLMHYASREGEHPEGMVLWYVYGRKLEN